MNRLQLGNEGAPIQRISFQGDRDLSNDSYLIYLTKKYKIEFNSALDKFMCEDKLFTSSEEALAFANSIDINEKSVKKSSLDKDNFVICGTCTGKNSSTDKTCRYCRVELVV